MKRREFLAGMAAASGVGWLASHPLLAESATTDKVLPVDQLVTLETRSAIERGLNFLARRQVRSGVLQGAFGSGGYASGVAVTSLAGLAFLCSGSTPVAGQYARNIRECTRFLLRHTRDSGYIASDSSHFSNMYGHGYAMLYLSQILGMSNSEAVMEKLKLAVEMTCNIQNQHGGWRYQPVKQDADLSITICQIMALRAAHDAGLQVSEEVRAKTVDYVKRSQNSDGSFRYTLRGGRSTLALTAAGVVSLYSAGIYEGEIVEKALKWMIDRKPGVARGQTVSPMNYYYAHYYAVQAMWHAQLKHPEYWNTWYPAIRDELLQVKRAQDGTWPDERVGPEFGTAMASIILQIPYNYVPVFAP